MQPSSDILSGQGPGNLFMGTTYATLEEKGTFMIIILINTGITKHEFLPEWVGSGWVFCLGAFFLFGWFFKSEDFPTLRIKSTIYFEKEQVSLQT